MKDNGDLTRLTVLNVVRYNDFLDTFLNPREFSWRSDIEYEKEWDINCNTKNLVWTAEVKFSHLQRLGNNELKKLGGYQMFSSDMKWVKTFYPGREMKL